MGQDGVDDAGSVEAGDHRHSSGRCGRLEPAHLLEPAEGELDVVRSELTDGSAGSRFPGIGAGSQPLLLPAELGKPGGLAVRSGAHLETLVRNVRPSSLPRGVSCAVKDAANPMRRSPSKAPTRDRCQPLSARQARIRAVSPSGTQPVGRAWSLHTRPAPPKTGRPDRVGVRQRRIVGEVQGPDIHGRERTNGG